MSLVITLHVREGIVMAADSRLTLTQQMPQGTGTMVNLSVSQSDSNYKLFCTRSDVGIATFGAADINGVPIAGYLEQFVEAELTASAPEEVAQQLLAHFSGFAPVPKTQFHVGGYAQHNGNFDQQVWLVDIVTATVSRLNVVGQQGVAWGGEGDILGRLIQPTAQLDPQGNILQRFPVFQVPWAFFTLQDAIDFAVFGVRATIDALRFQPRPKTVGGAVDVLVVKPSGATWVQRKELRVER